MKGEIVRGRELEGGLDEVCDVVIIGSGAGGAVIATHLAEAGLSVIVLEEGPHYTPQEIRGFRPTEAMRKMWREGGLLTTVPIGNSPIIAITVGRNVGGSSVHTGGVCFRVPSAIHHEWGARSRSTRALGAKARGRLPRRRAAHPRHRGSPGRALGVDATSPP